MEGANTYVEVGFDHVKVENCFNAILKDPTYRENMKKL